MRLLIIIMLSVFCSANALESVWSYFTGKTPISDPVQYAKDCLTSQDYPVVSSVVDASCPLRSASIPPMSLVYEYPIMSASSQILLRTNKDHAIHASMRSFHMEHHFEVVEMFKQRPWMFVGGYAALYFMPMMIATPLWTVGLVGGLGYTWWKNKDQFSQASFTLESARRLSGYQTTLGEALQRSEAKIKPVFQTDGQIRYQGFVPNGIIPGQSLYVDLVVTPEEILTR